MQYMKKLSLVFAAAMFLLAAPMCEAKTYTSLNEGFKLEIPDSFDVQNPPYSNPGVVMHAVDPTDHAQVSISVSKDRDADYRKGAVTGKALEDNKESMKKLIEKKKAYVTADGVFAVAPAHEALYIKFGKSFKDAAFEFVKVQMWAHKKIYTVTFMSRAEANRGEEFVKTAQTLTCLQKHE